MSLLDTLPFEARVRIYQAMDDSVEQIAHGLDALGLDPTEARC